MAKPGPVAVARHQAYDSGQIASGAVAADGNSGRIEIEGRAPLGDPACGSVGVFGCGRKLVFRRQPVIDRHDGAARANG